MVSRSQGFGSWVVSTWGGVFIAAAPWASSRPRLFARGSGFIIARDPSPGAPPPSASGARAGDHPDHPHLSRTLFPFLSLHLCADVGANPLPSIGKTGDGRGGFRGFGGNFGAVFVTIGGESVTIAARDRQKKTPDVGVRGVMGVGGVARVRGDTRVGG